MPSGIGTALITVGAILTFAVTAGPIGGVNVRAIGIVLMLAGAAILVLPPLLRRTRGHWR